MTGSDRLVAVLDATGAPHEIVSTPTALGAELVEGLARPG